MAKLPQRLRFVSAVSKLEPYIEVPGHGYYVYAGGCYLNPENDLQRQALAAMEHGVKSYLLWKITAPDFTTVESEEEMRREKARFFIPRMTAYKIVSFNADEQMLGRSPSLAGYALLSDSDTIEYRIRFEG